MAAEWLPLAGIGLGAAATMVAARLNSKPTDRGVAVTEMQAALSEQRIMLDRSAQRADALQVRVEGLEDEVQACEVGRDADRRQFRTELDELRAVIHRLSEDRNP